MNDVIEAELRGNIFKATFSAGWSLLSYIRLRRSLSRTRVFLGNSVLGLYEYAGFNNSLMLTW